MNCPNCHIQNQNVNTPCTSCGTLVVSMQQQVVIPAPPPLVYQVAQQPCKPQAVSNVPCSTTTPWWAWLLIVLASLGLIAGATLGIIALAKGATTAELVTATGATDKKIDGVEKNLTTKIDDVGKKVDTLDKNVGTVLTAIDKKIDVIDGNVKTVNENIKTVDENLAQAKNDLNEKIGDEAKATRDTVIDQGRKVRWSISRSERNFEAISDKLDRIERVKPTVTVRIAK